MDMQENLDLLMLLENMKIDETKGDRNLWKLETLVSTLVNHIFGG